MATGRLDSYCPTWVCTIRFFSCFSIFPMHIKMSNYTLAHIHTHTYKSLDHCTYSSNSLRSAKIGDQKFSHEAKRTLPNSAQNSQTKRRMFLLERPKIINHTKKITQHFQNTAAFSIKVTQSK